MIKDIEVINKDSNIAISTLWLRKEILLKKLSEDIKGKIAVIGTTYTSYGINYIFETLAQFNKIDTLIVFGPDLSTSGDTIKKIFGEKDFSNIKILVDLEKAKDICKTVKLIDLRENYKNSDFNSLIKSINENFKENASAVRESFKLTIQDKIDLQSWPIPLSGHYIYDNKSVFRIWVRILDLIMKFGSIKFSEYEEPQKEYLNVTATLGLYGNEYKIEEEFFEFMNAKEFEKHINEVLNLERPFGVTYTYGNRFFEHRFGKNQIDYLIKKLSEKPYSRRALVVSWDHEIDQKTPNPPCIIGLQGIITENFYNHIVFIRSNDMFRGWPVNFIGQIELAKYIVNKINEAAKTSFQIGTITTISVSAHIYQHDWVNVKNLLEKYYYKTLEFVEDPKGNFLIYEDNGKVVLEQRTPNNMDLVFKIESEKFWDIYNALKSGNMFSLNQHALYLGKELKTAFEKISKGDKYVQDHS